MARDDGSSGVVAAFLLGALAGAALAILYAPAAGTDTRRKLAERAREGRDQANRAWEKGREAFDRARGAAEGESL